MSPGVGLRNADTTTPLEPSAAVLMTVEFTEFGDLRIRAALAERYFPGDALVAARRGNELWLLPLTGPEGGGLLLKQRNPAGDRSTLIWEPLQDTDVVGERPAVWDEPNGALRVALAPHLSDSQR